MVRIAGVDLPSEKRSDIGLSTIFGIGRSNVKSILNEAKVDPAKRVRDLTREEINRLQVEVDKIVVEGALRQRVTEDINRLKNIGSYRGLRHIHGLPARGQRTRSNARTKRGRRRTVGALKKEDMARLETAKKTSE